MPLQLPHNSMYVADLLPNAHPSHLPSSNNVSCWQLFLFFSHFSSAYPFFIFFFFPLPPTGSHFCLPFPSLPVFHSLLFSFLQISSPCCTFYDCCSLIMIRKFISTIMIFVFYKKPKFLSAFLR